MRGAIGYGPAASAPRGICGANVINSQWLLTIARCCTDARTGVALDPVTVSFELGTNFDSTSAASSSPYNAQPGTIVQALEVYPHEEYNGRSQFGFDICLLKVSPFAIDNIKIKPIILPVYGYIYRLII